MTTPAPTPCGDYVLDPEHQRAVLRLMARRAWAALRAGSWAEFLRIAEAAERRRAACAVPYAPGDVLLRGPPEARAAWRVTWIAAPRAGRRTVYARAIYRTRAPGRERPIAHNRA